MASRIVLLVAVLAASAAGAGIRIEVTSDPKLPAPNLIDGKNPDGTVGPKYFEAGVKGKENCYSTFKPKTFKPGVRYVASCRIKPDKDVLFLKTNATGLGFSMSFVRPGWKLTTMHARGGCPMPDEWNTVYSEPVTMPEGTTDWFRDIGLRYNKKGTGWVDDLRVTVADATLLVRAFGPRPVRQVKVINAAGETAYDSGILTGKASVFEKSVVVNAAGTYTVMAVDDDGDVASVTYPEPLKTNPEKDAANGRVQASKDKPAELFVPTGRPQEDAWRDICLMPDGEIRHYGWDVSVTPAARVYESSRDDGRTWTLTGRGESAFTNRDVLHAAISEDDGETWKGLREIRINDVANRADFRQYGNDTKDSLDKSVRQAQAVELDDGTLVVADGQSPLYAESDFAPFGLSYLHLRTLAGANDPKGTYFTSFSMNTLQ